MTLRESMEKHPKVWGGACVTITVIALAISLRMLLSGGNGTVSRDPGNAFYTVDLGQTWFVDVGDRLAPFDHEGETAVKAMLFKCGDDGEPFVGYLERFTPEGRAMRERVNDPNAQSSPLDTAQIMNGFGREVRRPGPDGKWTDVLRNAAAAQQIMRVTCPDDQRTAQPFTPADS